MTRIYTVHNQAKKWFANKVGESSWAPNFQVRVVS